MATKNEERDVALRILSAAQAPRYQEQRDLAATQLGKYVYLSPMRPFWIGFDREAEADAGFVGYLGEMRLVETRQAASTSFLNRFELVPASPEAMKAVANELTSTRVNVALSHGAERRMAVAWRTGDGASVSEFDISEPGEPRLLNSWSSDDLGSALVSITQRGFSREVPDRYVGRYLGSAIEAQRLLAEVAIIRRGEHPGYAGLSDRIENADSFLRQYAQDEPELAADIAADWRSSPDEHSGRSGLSPERVAQLGGQLLSLSNRSPEIVESGATQESFSELKSRWLALGSDAERVLREGLAQRFANVGVAEHPALITVMKTDLARDNAGSEEARKAAIEELQKLGEREAEGEKKMAAKKQKWVDLAEHGIFLGDQRMADGKHRLVVLDMQDRGDPARLREIGFLPVAGSPRYDKGIYYLHGDDQRLRPKALAAAFGIENCPLIEVSPTDIDRVFREKITEKFGANLNALALRSRPLGQNRAGQYVFESPAGRFIRLSVVNAVAEGSQQAAKLGRPAFLRASNDEELRACAEGFLWTIRQGGKTAWPDLVRFAKTVYGKHAPDNEPTDEQLHRLQEAVEAASYRRFTALASKPDEAAFRLGMDFYYGLPTARMRTAESVFLQQYSTPLPMSVVAQRLLVGNDDLTGKTAFEPTAGNGGLVNLLPESVQVYGVELDANRFAALRETGRIKAHLGDATEVNFRRVFGVEQGFDYTIANPPFGQMDAPKTFDKIPSVRKLDHYIPLRALEARKDAGRSVVIFGADSAQSDGTIKGGAKAFLNYLHDHYEVHGVTEVDGRLYARHGAGFNVRLLVIGDKRPEPIQAEVPEKLPIITSYDDLWRWAGHVIECYDAPKPEPVKVVEEKVIGEPTVSASELGVVEPVFGAGGDSVVPVAVEPGDVLQPTALTENGTMPETGEVREPGRLPSMAVVRDSDGNLFIVTHGRFDGLGGQPFTPGERPEMSHEVQVRFDLSNERRNTDFRAGPVFYTGLVYEGDWENAAKYQTPGIQQEAVAADREVSAETEDVLANVPVGVRDRIGYALTGLRDIYARLENVERARGKGHILALEVRDMQPGVERYRAVLAEFREFAPQNGVDAEKVIVALGGEPDLSTFGEPAPEEKEASPVAASETGTETEYPGYTRLPNGNVAANRAVLYTNLSVGRLEALLAREGTARDIEALKDYKWMLLFDTQAAVEKGFMDEVADTGAVGVLPKNKFWMTNIDAKISALGGNPQDLTNNPVVLEAQKESVASEEEKPSVSDADVATKVAVDVATPEPVEPQPWQLTLEAWNSEVSANKAGSGIGVPTRNSGSEAATRFKRLEFLKYGVTDWAREKLVSAQRGEIKLTQEELAEITDRLDTPVSHRDVIDKALSEGKPVPQAVLADYPDLSAPIERHVNEFQAPYQAASRVGEPSAMVPINMAGATYAALNDLESRFGGIDRYVAGKLRYEEEELSRYFSAEQVDAIGLAIKAVEEGRGIINADQTGMGKGRFVAAMLRYAKLNEKVPVFLTIKPELFTDIFRDISDIGSQHLFKKLFIFNDGENVKRFGTENEVLYRATTPQERKAALTTGMVEPDTDMVLATYSQFMRAYHKNPKAGLLTEIAANNGMLILDEAHVASGASNLSSTVGQAVANSDAVLYSSATPLKGVSNFAIYNKIFPSSVDLKTLPDTLKAGGEALQEAISTNMARDGVLIRREHDFSKLTFHTRNPDPAQRERNVALANALADIIGDMAYLAGDVSKSVSDLNKGYKKDWEEIPERDRMGARMQASSMNFGSRLYSLNRQFLLGIKIEDAVETALNDLANGRKPVIAVENTGESLLRQVISRRAGIDHLEAELTELDERAGALSEQDQARRDVLISSINDAMRNVVLDEPPQYRELLESMLDRIGVIKIQGRYGDVQRIKPESEEYEEREESIRERIRAFPDLPLTPIDVIKKELERRGHPVAEVSGRTASITPNAANPEMWDVNFHGKSDAVANVAGFQNGKYDAIVITRSGSTGISLHATDRFDDSDIRQRDFIVLQKAANIAEFLQWMGRVNRKDQVVPPVVTGLESGLPAELRLTMMHNAKLRKLSANTTSNRENANLEGEEFDLLNDVGDRVALEWLAENPDIAERLDIDLPNEDDLEDMARFSQECPYINKLMGRLMMVSVDKQEEILKALTERFADKLEELEQRGENPFKVDVFDWKAKFVKEEELQSGVIRSEGSTFDEPVKLVTVRYEQQIFPIRSDKLLGMVKTGLELFRADPSVDERGSLRGFRDQLLSQKDGWVRRQLPTKLRESDAPLAVLLEGKDVAGAKGAKERSDWLLANLESFRPGVRLTHEDPFKGERKGVITSVELPKDKEDFFLLSKYRAKVAFPGEDKVREITLATVRTQGKDLSSGAWVSVDPEKAVAMPHIKRHVDQVLAEFDDAPDGKLIRTQYVLQGNIYRACELANKQKLGWPILFTDEEGNRQRAVLLKDRITPDMVKALPIGLDARDVCDYIDEYLDPKHPEFRQRSMYGSFHVYDAGVKDMKRGDGIMFEVLNGGDSFRLSIPGTKSRAGALMTDGSIFDIGQKTPEGSLRLKLSGNKTYMHVDVDRDDLLVLMDRMQRNHHVGKFYVPEPDHEVIKTLKERFRLEHGRNLEITTDDSPSP